MLSLTIDTTSKETIQTSFDRIAEGLFNNYWLKVNDVYYRLLDIEFYFHDDKEHSDIYTHKHKNQLEEAKWYFHKSGIDITIGNSKHHGGILLRAIGRISEDGKPQKHFITDEIHGPVRTKTEIFNNFSGPFEAGTNIFQFEDISEMDIPWFEKPVTVYQTSRIGLSSKKDTDDKFHDAQLRYVIFPELKLAQKTLIAEGLERKGELSSVQINELLGSKFLEEN